MVKDNRVYTVSDPLIPACYFPFAYTVMYILTKIPAFYAFGIFIVLMCQQFSGQTVTQFFCSALVSVNASNSCRR